MNEDLGKLLSSTRKAKKLTLEEVAKETKIQKRYILDMEEEKFEDLPGKTYEKGFLKTYGTLLELDIDMLIEMYKSIRNIEEENIEEEKKEKKEIKSSKNNGILMLLLGGILLILVGAFLIYKFVIGDYTSRDREKIVTEQVVELEAGKMTDPQLQEEEIGERQEQNETEEFEKAEETGKIEEIPKIEEAEKIVKENPIVEVVSTKVASAEKNIEEKKEIVLKFNGTSWLEIRKNGSRIFYDNAKKGEMRIEGKADDKIFVKIGDSSKAEIKYNGKNLGILGNKNEIYKKTF